MTSKHFLENKSLIVSLLLIVATLFVGSFYLYDLISENEVAKLGNKEQGASNLIRERISALDDGDVIRLTCGGLEIDAEVAVSFEKKQEGYMFREEPLDPTEGMIFIYERPRNLTFWMKNTYVTLDIIFLDSDLKAVTIQDDMHPNQVEETYSSNGDALYALEVYEDFLEDTGFKEGESCIL